MAIDPIQMMSFGNMGVQQDKAVTPGGGFENVFKNAWNTTVENEQDLAQKQYLLSIGEIDDTHTVPIAASKADLSLSLMVNLRNKALEAYNELMRISV